MSEYELALADLLAAGDAMVETAERAHPFTYSPFSIYLQRANVRLIEALANLRKAAPEAPVTIDRG